MEEHRACKPPTAVIVEKEVSLPNFGFPFLKEGSVESVSGDRAGPPELGNAGRMPGQTQVWFPWVPLRMGVGDDIEGV